MANPLYGAFRSPIYDGGMSEIIRQAKELKKTFKGNPKNEVQRLLDSGQMTQQEFNRLSQIANQIAQIIGEE